MDELKGESSEHWLTIDLKALMKDLAPHPEIARKINAAIRRSQDAPKGGGFDFMTLDELAELLPPGVGKGFLGPASPTAKHRVEIDLRAAVALACRRNCLDSR